MEIAASLHQAVSITFPVVFREDIASSTHNSSAFHCGNFVKKFQRRNIIEMIEKTDISAMREIKTKLKPSDNLACW
jgi:hypothetical protein